MELIEKVEKIVESRYGPRPKTVSDKEYDRIIRQLMCRLIDVDDMFPYEYDDYDAVKDEYLIDFLRPEADRDFTYAIERSRSNGYKLVITDWLTDQRHDTIIKIPSFILQDDWVDNVEAQKKHRRINEIDKDIQKIEEVLTNGNARILELKEEKLQLEVELKLIEK